MTKLPRKPGPSLSTHSDSTPEDNACWLLARGVGGDIRYSSYVDGVFDTRR